MGLFIPTSGNIRQLLSQQALAKGRLYNLDDDEFIGFQFNPETFGWERDHRWLELFHRGGDRTSHLTLLGHAPREFELNLLYMADPGAGHIEYKSREGHTTGTFDFPFLKETIERWESKREELRRSTLLAVIFAGPGRETEPLVLHGVIARSQFRVLNWFNDLAVREVQINLEFKEWRSSAT